MTPTKIATSIVKRKTQANAAIRAALSFVNEKQAIGMQDSGPGSGFNLAPTAPLTNGPRTFVNNNAVAQEAARTAASAAAQRRATGASTPWEQGVANSKRISSGILNSLAGGLGTLGAGGLYGSNALWNAVTPESMNTSSTHTEFTKNLVDEMVKHTNESAADVATGLGYKADHNSYLHDAFKQKDPKDYFAPTATQRIVDKTYSTPGLDPDSLAARSARVSAATGEELWNTAQAVMGAKILGGGAARLPGAQAVRSGMAPLANSTAGKATTLLTGVPIAQVNPWAYMGSMALQSQLGNALAAQDNINAQNGIETNWSSASNVLPANWAPNAMSAVAGPDAAAHAQRMMGVGAFGTTTTAAPAYLAPHAIGGPLDVALNRGAAAAPPSWAQEQFFEPLPETAANNPPLPDEVSAEQPAPEHEPRRPFDDDYEPPQQSVATPSEPPATPAPEQAASEQAAPEQAVAQNDTTTPAQTSDQQPQQPAHDIPGLIPDATPEQIEQARAAQQTVSEHPQAKQAVGDQTGKIADEVVNNGQPVHANTVSADYSRQNPPPQNAQDWGEWFSGLMQHINTSWESLGRTGQLAFGLGVPLGVIGLLGGGLPGFLLGAAGLGAAGIAGASNGMFGDTAKTHADNIMAGVGLMTGEDPNNKPATTAPGTAATSAAAQAPKPDLKPEDITPDKQLGALTSLANSRPEDVAKIMADNKQMYDHMANLPESDMLALFQKIPPNAQQNLVQRLTGAQQTLQRAINTLDNDSTGLMTPVVAAMLPKGMTLEEIPMRKEQVDKILATIGRTKSSAQNYVQNTLMLKIARCWKGYEPVPGSKPYTEGSCRPKGSKKTQKEMKKKSEAAILTIIRGYYGKQACTQSTEIRTKGKSQTGTQGEA